MSLNRCLETERTGERLFVEYMESRQNVVKKLNEKEAQACLGDFYVCRGESSGRFFELKTERRWTGNIFYEVWSNRSRRTPAWGVKCQCDFLAYAFLDTSQLYIFHFPTLHDWFWNTGVRYCEMTDAGRHSQLNDTWGYLVPINDITTKAQATKAAVQWTSEGGDPRFVEVG